jgi:hypothetical protein
VIAAQWEMSRKSSPEKALAAAEAAVARAEGLGDLTPHVVDARVRLEKRRVEWHVSQARDVRAALARAKAAVSQLEEVVGKRGVRRVVADLALLEARSLDKAKGTDAQRRRADAIATARRELAAGHPYP